MSKLLRDANAALNAIRELYADNTPPVNAQKRIIAHLERRASHAVKPR